MKPLRYLAFQLSPLRLVGNGQICSFQRHNLFEQLMISIIWKFEVDPSHKAEFEKVYGPKGKWAQFFQQASEYQGTVLLRNRTDSTQYFTIDRWDSFSSFQRFKMQHREFYQTFDKECEKLTLSEQKVGHFEEIACHPTPR